MSRHGGEDQQGLDRSTGGGRPERPVVLVAAEPAVRRLVIAALEPEGFRVTASAEPEIAFELLADVLPDVVILETVGPDGPGYRTLRQLAASDPVPIIVMSASSNPASVIHALDAGAHDFVTRPFHAAELAARIRSLVRRRGTRLASGSRRVGAATVDLERRQVVCEGRATPLARSDWRLLLRLLADEGQLVTYDELLVAAFGWESRGDVASLHAAMARLRRKLGVRSAESGPIQTVRGFGYKLVKEPGIEKAPAGTAGALQGLGPSGWSRPGRHRCSSRRDSRRPSSRPGRRWSRRDRSMSHPGRPMSHHGRRSCR